MCQFVSILAGVICWPNHGEMGGHKQCSVHMHNSERSQIHAVIAQRDWLVGKRRGIGEGKTKHFKHCWEWEAVISCMHVRYGGTQIPYLRGEPMSNVGGVGLLPALWRRRTAWRLNVLRSRRTVTTSSLACAAASRQTKSNCSPDHLCTELFFSPQVNSFVEVVIALTVLHR